MNKEINTACIGLGPANLALMLALRELCPAHLCLSTTGYESKAEFGWHTGMLVDNGTMQVSFLKDLVTQRNPNSGYSFLAYLKAHDRLTDFINLRTFYPTRAEFHDYLSWCACQLGDAVRYSSRLEHISIARAAGATRLDLHFDNRIERADAVVLGRGLRLKYPSNVVPGPRAWHTADFLPRVSSLNKLDNHHFVVAGGGQSAAECVLYLHDHFPTAIIHLVFSSFGMKPADDSPFVNQIFDQESVEFFFSASDEAKEEILRKHSDTNYGVVDLDVLRELYQRIYREKVVRAPRIVLHRCSRVSRALQTSSRVDVVVSRMHESADILVKADYLICASGYESQALAPLLSDELLSLLKLGERGKPIVDLDHRVALNGNHDFSIYSQEDCECSHGLSATLISNLAIRSGRIANSLIANHAAARRISRA